MHTIARLKLKDKHFEILVDCEKAIELKKKKANSNDIRDVLVVDEVFKDHKKGLKFSQLELVDAFGTEDIYEIAAKILNEGELLLPQSYREKEREAKFKQVVNFIARNCIDPRTNAPYTAERIESLLKEVGVKIEENKPADEQALRILREIESKIPIKFETKKIQIKIPAAYVGKAYGFIAKLKHEKEEWLPDGSFECIIYLPVGMQAEFYDRLNALTHGSAITKEVS